MIPFSLFVILLMVKVFFKPCPENGLPYLVSYPAHLGDTDYRNYLSKSYGCNPHSLTLNHIT